MKMKKNDDPQWAARVTRLDDIAMRYKRTAVLMFGQK